MSPLDRRLAIAHALGARWRNVYWLGEPKVVLSIDSFPELGPDRWKLGDGRILHSDVEDYDNDLTAAVMAVRKLAHDSAIGARYGHELVKEVLHFTGPAWDDTITLNYWALARITNARAEERISALLKALKLYT